MELFLSTPNDTAKTLADRIKNLRLAKKWKRSTLAERSGVTLASLIRFEQNAQIAFESFLKLVSALDRLDEVEKLLLPPPARSIDELETQEIKPTKRGSI